MGLTVAEIAKQAFDGVAAALDGVVLTATITQTVQGDYDVESGRYETTAASQTGRAVIETASALAKRYPAYVSGPDDILIILEGFTMVPIIGAKIEIKSVERTIKQVGDIVGAGELIEVVAA